MLNLGKAMRSYGEPDFRVRCIRVPQELDMSAVKRIVHTAVDRMSWCSAVRSRWLLVHTRFVRMASQTFATKCWNHIQVAKSASVRSTVQAMKAGLRQRERRDTELRHVGKYWKLQVVRTEPECHSLLRSQLFQWAVSSGLSAAIGNHRSWLNPRKAL